VVCYRHRPKIWLRAEGTMKTSISIVGVSAEIRTQYLSNASLKRYRYASLFGLVLFLPEVEKSSFTPI
jgi:hypothetical protein